MLNKVFVYIEHTINENMTEFAVRNKSHLIVHDKRFYR